MEVSRAIWRVAAVFILLSLNGFVLRVPPAMANTTDWEYSLFMPFMGNAVAPMPIPPPVGVYISETTTFAYRSNLSNAVYLLGEVNNNSGQTVGEIYLQARLYNGQGQLLDTRGVFTSVPVLAKGSKTCFAIIFPNDDGRLNNWASYTFDAPLYALGVREPHNLVISQLAGRLDATTKEYIVTGSIRNEETSQVRCIQAVSSLYNAQGKVTGCAAAYIASLHLNAGSSSQFEVRFYGRNYSDYTGFAIQADGTP